jgi:hypothetical protein
MPVGGRFFLVSNLLSPIPPKAAQETANDFVRLKSIVIIIVTIRTIDDHGVWAEIVILRL